MVGGGGQLAATAWNADPAYTVCFVDSELPSGKRRGGSTRQCDVGHASNRDSESGNAANALSLGVIRAEIPFRSLGNCVLQRMWAPGNNASPKMYFQTSRLRNQFCCGALLR